MKLVSTTLAGPGTEATLGQALQSVAPYVDEVLILVDKQNPRWQGLVDAAKKAVPAEKLRAVSHPWTGFGPARQAALQAATASGADWCIWVDADEWMEIEWQRLQAALKLAPADQTCFHFYDQAHMYVQPRVIRLPCPAKWEGLTHEGIAISGPTFPWARFCSHDKTAEEVRGKRLRDIELLKKAIEKDPGDARWYYYLGDAYEGIGKYDKAIQAYARRAQMMRGSGEEGAWACYRAACLLILSDTQYDRGIQFCVQGLRHYPGIAELAWMAGIGCLRMGRFEHALQWSNIALTHGLEQVGPFRAVDRRVLFRDFKGLLEGPREVRQFALAALGEVTGAAQAQEKLLETAVTQVQSSIPKIIHTVWPGRDPFREMFHPWRESWMRHNPDWIFVFHRVEPTLDPRVNAVLAHPECTPVFKSGVLRWRILLDWGGFYVDADFECLQPFDRFRNVPAGFWCTREPPWPGGRESHLSNALLGAQVGHPFVRRMLDGILRRFEEHGMRVANTPGAENPVSGPAALSKAVAEAPPGEVEVLDSSLFFPEMGGADVYAQHHWNSAKHDGNRLALESMKVP